VVISEAVELVGDLSTDASSGFVNGLLARLADRKPTIVLYPEPEADAPDADAPETAPVLETAPAPETAPVQETASAPSAAVPSE
jgi:hypothetical protein